MKKNKEKKVDRPAKEIKEIDSGELGEGNAFNIGFLIPGRGRININISFEKERRINHRQLKGL